MANRRFILALPILGVVACANPAQTQTDLDLITAFAQSAGPVLIAARPALTTTVNAAVGDIVAADKTLGGVITANTGQSTAQQIITDVQVLAPLVISTLPPGSVYVLAAQAAVALLPAIARAAGLTGATTTRATTMDEGAARAVLRGLR